VTRHVPVLVVGGGLSGLVGAYALQKAGIEVLLVEASPRPGGIIQSTTRDGFLLELGPQSFSCTSQLRALCDELGIVGQLLEAPAKAPRYVVVESKLRRVPMNPVAFFFNPLMDGRAKWALVRDVFGKSFPPEADESVAAFMRRKFTDQLLDRFVGPFVSGIYAGDPEKLSLRSAFPMLHEAEEAFGSILRGMLRLAKNRKGPRERRTLNSFRDGNETLVRALASKLGPALRCNAGVTDIQQGGAGTGPRGRRFVVDVESRSDRETFVADWVILATPTNAAAAVVKRVAPESASALELIEYAAVVVVSLGYRKTDVGHDLDGFGFLVPRSAGLRVLGTVWNSSLFPGRAPDGHALLTTFVGGAMDPTAAKLSSQELTSLVHTEISPLLSIKKEPIFANVTIWPRALPQYNLGHGERVTRFGSLPSLPLNLRIAGNYLRGPAIGTCVEQSLAVAEEVRAHLLR
jgi:protoporphyrinogen/coproporphyrinogen III oxidase